MDRELRSELKDMLSRLEGALRNVDSEYQRDKEDLEHRYQSKKEGLQQALDGVRVALNEGDQPKIEVGTSREIADPGLPREETNAAAHSNGSSSVGSTGVVVKRFSPRHEIEKLLLELEPGQDIKQGEIRHILETRFPQHKPSLKPATISSALRRISRAGGLVKVAEGSGSEPNVYRLPNRDNGRQEELSELRE